MLLRRWLPHRPLVLVGDNGYAVLDLLHCCQSLREPVTLAPDCAWTPPSMRQRPPARTKRPTAVERPPATGQVPCPIRIKDFG